MGDSTSSSSLPTDAHALGAMLEPALRQELGGRLSDIQWFRSTWQRGGAATGMARFRHDARGELDVMVKLPVGPVEHRWTTALAQLPPITPGALPISGPTPEVLAAGTALGGYDLGWLVIERLHGKTLHHGWCRESLDDLIRAAAEVQAAASRVGSPSRPPEQPEWERQMDRAREVARESGLPEAQHWKEAVKKVQKVLPQLARRWAARPIDSWCHGDLHPGNAMHREALHPATGRPRTVLIDLALVHPGHWVEDAVYLERQFWGKPEGLFGIHVVSQMARYRRELGLKTDGDYGMIANVRRVLMAACAPAHVAAEGNPRYLHGALETIDRVLPMVAHPH